MIDHGIYRDFPTRYRIAAARRCGSASRSSAFSATAPTSPGSRSARATASGSMRAMPTPTSPPGEHVYAIRYRTTRQLGFFKDYDELYWNATGNGWVFPIDVAEARIRLPRPVPFGERAFYTGPQGSTARDAEVVSERPGEIVFRTTAPLGPAEGLTVAAAWPKGVVTRRRRRPAARLWLQDNGPPAGGRGRPRSGVLAYYFHAWRRAGRDPKAGDDGADLRAARRPLRGGDALHHQDGRRQPRLRRRAGRARGRRPHPADRGGRRLLQSRQDDGSTGLPAGRRPAEPEASMLSRLFAGGDSILMEQKNHATFSGAKEALETGLKRNYEGRLFVRNRIWAVRGSGADGRSARRSGRRRPAVGAGRLWRQRRPGRHRGLAPAGRRLGPLFALSRLGRRGDGGQGPGRLPRRDRAGRRRRHHRQRGREHRRVRRDRRLMPAARCRCSPCRWCSPPSAGWPRRPARAAPCSIGSPASATISRSPRRSGSRRSIRPRRRPNCSSAICPTRSRSRSRMTGPRASPRSSPPRRLRGRPSPWAGIRASSDPWNDPGDFADSVGSLAGQHHLLRLDRAGLERRIRGRRIVRAAAAAAAAAAAGKAARAARIRSASSRSDCLSTSIAASAKGRGTAFSRKPALRPARSAAASSEMVRVTARRKIPRPRKLSSFRVRLRSFSARAQKSVPRIEAGVIRANRLAPLKWPFAALSQVRLVSGWACSTVLRSTMAKAASTPAAPGDERLDHLRPEQGWSAVVTRTG